MRIGALIPARLSSKRLLRKNIRPLAGKPLLMWTADTLLKAGVFQSVVVSTESDEVADLVRERYPRSEVAVLERPAELSGDRASLTDVMDHYLAAYPVDYVGLFMPTYPFRDPEKIRREIVPHLLTGAVLTVKSTRYGTVSTYDYWMPEGNLVRLMYLWNELHCAVLNSAYLFFRRGFHRETNKFARGIALHERQLMVDCTFSESIDIDTPDDFALAERVVHEGEPQFQRIVPHDFGRVTILMPEGVNINGFLGYVGKTPDDPCFPKLFLGPTRHLFTQLDLNGRSGRRQYFTFETHACIQACKEKVASQDYPDHYQQLCYYRIVERIDALPKERPGLLMGEYSDRGITVPMSRVIWETDFKRWPGYVEPMVWPTDLK